MRLGPFVAAAALFAACFAAHADTLTTFAIEAQVSTSAYASSTFEGSVVYDGTIGIFSGGTISGLYGPAVFFFRGAPVDATPVPGVIQATFTAADQTFFQFQVETSELAQPAYGVYLCTSTCGDAVQTTGYPSYFEFFGGPELPITAGMLTVESTVVGLPGAVSPEPSTIALLGTGLLGMGGVVKRRLA